MKVSLLFSSIGFATLVAGAAAAHAPAHGLPRRRSLPAYANTKRFTKTKKDAPPRPPTRVQRREEGEAGKEGGESSGKAVTLFGSNGAPTATVFPSAAPAAGEGEGAPAEGEGAPTEGEGASPEGEGAAKGEGEAAPEGGKEEAPPAGGEGEGAAEGGGGAEGECGAGANDALVVNFALTLE